SLAFGPDKGGLIGGLEWAGLRGVGPGPSSYAPTIPHQAFMLFQMMFAVITPALITGAFAERKKFAAYLLFLVLWATLVYDPLAHWVWGEGGFLRKLGALDFAGGTVVHLSSGTSALVCALMIGKRKGYPQTPMPPHNLPLTLIGAGLLWFGWFGFNAGSALEASGLAANAFLATNTGAAAAALGWMVAEWKLRGKPTADGLFHGNPGQFWTQLVAVLATIALAAPMTYVILKIVDALIGVRVREDDEVTGLDLSQHSENAYVLGGSVVGEHVSASRDDVARRSDSSLVGALGKG